MKIIYSRAPVHISRGELYQNPRHFSGPVQGASAVVIHGSFPGIEGAYIAAQVPVQVIGGAPAEPVQFAMGAAEREHGGDVAIPADWRDLPWTQPEGEGHSLRGLASSVSDAPVLTKAQAIEAIEAELARRAG